MSVTDTMFESLLSRDAQGVTCITEENLDRIWPSDDREPEVVVGKWLEVPPTCTSVMASCEARFGRETCLEYAFGGWPLPSSGDVAAIPVPPGLALGLTACAAFLLLRRMRSGETVEETQARAIESCNERIE